jgi:hypothetical protein
MKKHAPPSFVSAILAIALMDATARVFGFARVMRLAHSLAGKEGGVNADAQLIEETATSVITAGAFYPRRAMCLEQSLALFVLLRRRGVPADLRVGVQTLPFSAHAWVEVDGQPINEKQGHIEQLATFQHVGV